ncbi:hypothetical protein GZ78_08060 [Endozoicomonas numazuensis]|uniref:Uncharacterized protein n=1 Tax=Endozoicomonas numazuensis TaxID=1137799 RepID=A0A081NMX9_9GAMM|nr:hypothetical protein GZ78_08060 [Endozoicomonas numazuensis]
MLFLIICTTFIMGSWKVKELPEGPLLLAWMVPLEQASLPFLKNSLKRFESLQHAIINHIRSSWREFVIWKHWRSGLKGSMPLNLFLLHGPIALFCQN